MAKQVVDTGSTVHFGELFSTIATDAKVLLKQQGELFRAEVGQELRRAANATASIAAGGGLAIAGSLLGGMAAAHLLSRISGLPMWLCYGLAAAGLGSAGAKCLLAGRDGFVGLQPLPQTTQSLGDNLEWLQEQLTPVGG